jgi:S1-C subfamily serine protease
MKFIAPVLGLVKYAFISLIFFSNVFSSTDPKLLAKLQPYVVSIKSRSIVAAYGDVSPTAGTGFIVDAKNGYIFSNAHVAAGNKVIAEYLATLSSGKEIPLKLIYSDPTADIAVFQGDLKDMGLTEDLSLSSDSIQTGTNVLIIGKNENRHFSTQTGVVANPNEIEGHLPQHAMRISLNMQGGGSGSMVYDVASGKVIGIIFASNMATSAFALPIAYGVEILESLKAGKEPKRFSLGAIFTYSSLGDLVKYYSFSEDSAVEYAKKYPEAFHRALKVHSIMPDSPAEGVLEAGDCILEIDGQEIGPNLYKLDKIINEIGVANKKVKLSIVRYGKKMKLSIAPYNMNDRQVKRMVVFGGATFFEADDVMIRRSGLKGKNRVLITNARLGSAFIEKLPMFPGSNHALICVEKLGNHDIFTLNDVIKAIPSLIKSGHFTIAFRNYGIKIGYDEKIIFNQGRLLEEINVFEQDGGAEEFYFDNKTHAWAVNRLAG